MSTISSALHSLAIGLSPLRWKASAAVLLMAVFYPTAVAENAEGPVGRDAREVRIQTPDKKELTVMGYREMEFRGLRIRMINPAGDSTAGAQPETALLRANERGALETFKVVIEATGAQLAPTLIGVPPAKRDVMPLPLVEALTNYPGIIVAKDYHRDLVVVFELNKPARIYAYLDWRSALEAVANGWRQFHADPAARHAVYFRDFLAGRNEMKLGPGFFSGVGVSPLDRLSEAEKIVPVYANDHGQPVLRIRSDQPAAREFTLRYAWRNPAASAPLLLREAKLTVKPGENLVAIPADGALEGVVYWVEVTLTGGNMEWKINAPFGRFAPPPPEASVTTSSIPYGAYMKIETNDAPEFYDTLLAATFFQMRRLKMNAAVLAGAEPPMAHLDLAQRYGIRVVARLNRVGGEEQERIMKHPAVLTYMVGDEPKIGPKLEAHIAQLKGLTAKYPQFKPITCTIFDSWGTGDDADPDRIYNDHLKDFKMVRMGRLYCFQKLDYGVGKPIAYTPRQEATSIMLGLEADTSREWWLVPPFFGQTAGAPASAQYWRTPTGLEITNFMHLALAHRCTGLLGWGTHSHMGVVQGLLFNGRTMQITSPETFSQMVQFGEQFSRIKPVLQAFTPMLIPVARTRPFAVDAQARWLKTGQMAIYVVNRDLENEVNADLMVLVGDRLAAQTNRSEVQPEAFVAEVQSVRDAITGGEIAWKHETLSGRFDHLRLVEKLGPGAARLYIVSGKHEGRFSEKAVPPGMREQFFDKAYAPID